jgi:ADP-heptose:LPS heptosyltransferase
LTVQLHVNRVLIIQTAFIGDVILATSLIEETKKRYPQAKIQFLLRTGNESLLKNHPHLEKLWIWNKKGGKYRNLFALVKEIKQYEIDVIVNVQRFFSSGLFTTLIPAKLKIGFKQNPLSFLFSKKINHLIPHAYPDAPYGAYHEVQRNIQLLNAIDDRVDISHDPKAYPPKLYFSPSEKVRTYLQGVEKYLVVAPTSVWETKEWPVSKWLELVRAVCADYKIFIIGAPVDSDKASQLCLSENVTNLCGQLSLLESAELMQKAHRVFVNDSAPMHLASSVDAHVVAIYNSTIPEFGYYPISTFSHVVEAKRPGCKPCGVHGHNKCPLTHYQCAYDIQVQQLLDLI